MPGPFQRSDKRKDPSLCRKLNTPRNTFKCNQPWFQLSISASSTNKQNKNNLIKTSICSFFVCLLLTQTPSLWRYVTRSNNLRTVRSLKGCSCCLCYCLSYFATVCVRFSFRKNKVFTGLNVRFYAFICYVISLEYMGWNSSNLAPTFSLSQGWSD